MFNFIILFLIISNFALLISSCGITTHTVIGHRAAVHYEHLLNNQTSIFQLLKKYESAYQAGNLYPDLFYGSQCLKGKLSVVSEDTHWVPFLNATINYIHEHYSKPYNEDALRLIAFTLGFTSHQMADVTWHSLGISQGFLSAMGYINFHGSFNAAHSVGDIGGDIMNQYELDTKYILNLGDWYVPYNDLFNIYKNFYGDERVSKNDIIECSSILFLGRLGEKLAISLLYKDYANKSTFLDDKLNDYFLGGLNDMTAWTQISWNKVLLMLETESNACHLPAGSRSILDLNCNSNIQMDTDSYSKNHKYFQNKLNHKKSKEQNILNGDKSFLSLTQEKNGVMLKTSNKFKLLIDQYQKKIDQYQNKIKNYKNDFISPEKMYSNKNEYSNFGYSLSATGFNSDQIDDLLIGAPVYSDINNYQAGAVFLMISNTSSNILDNYMTFRPPKNVLNSRYGHSVISLDLNLDGFTDIIVGAPSYGLNNKTYQGRVYIYFGNKNVSYNEVSIEITCQEFEYCNLGWFLTTGDVNGDNHTDILISSPYASTCADQCGYLGVLFAAKKEFNSVIKANDLDFVIYGNMAYEWFGHSVVSKNGYIAVGAPESRLCDDPKCDFSIDEKQAIGRVYLYKYPYKNAIHVITGKSEFEQFGYSFDMIFASKNSNSTKLIISVSSVTKETKLANSRFAKNLKNAGEVYLFEFNTQNMSNKDSLIATLKSDQEFAYFGSRVKFFGNDLYISATMRKVNDGEFFFEEPTGVLFRFKNGIHLRGNVTDDCSFFKEKPCPSEKALVYTNFEKRSKFGFQFTVLKRKNKVDKLVVSSIFSHNGNLRLNGKVNIFQL